MKNKKGETKMQTITIDEKKYKVEAKSTTTELKNINDTLLKLYNTSGMALHFQPSNLKILKKQIERLILLEQVLFDKPIKTI